MKKLNWKQRMVQKDFWIGVFNQLFIAVFFIFGMFTTIIPFLEELGLDVNFAVLLGVLGTLAGLFKGIRDFLRNWDTPGFEDGVFDKPDEPPQDGDNDE